MGDPAGEASDDFQLLRMLQLLLECRALRDVARVEHDPFDGGIGEQIACDGLHRAQRAIGVDHLAAQRLGGKGPRGHTREKLGGHRAVLRRNPLDKSAAQPQLGVEPEHALDCGTHVACAQRRIEHHDDVTRVLHERAKTRIARGPLAPQARGVARRDALAGYREHGHHERAGTELHLHVLSIVADREKEHSEGERHCNGRNFRHPPRCLSPRRALPCRVLQLRCGCEDWEHDCRKPANIESGIALVPWRHLQIAIPEVGDRRAQVAEREVSENGATAVIRGAHQQNRGGEEHCEIRGRIANDDRLAGERRGGLEGSATDAPEPEDHHPAEGDGRYVEGQRDAISASSGRDRKREQPRDDEHVHQDEVQVNPQRQGDLIVQDLERCFGRRADRLANRGDGDDQPRAMRRGLIARNRPGAKRPIRHARVCHDENQPIERDRALLGHAPGIHQGTKHRVDSKRANGEGVLSQRREPFPSRSLFFAGG